jgi:hypothetical protein
MAPSFKSFTNAHDRLCNLYSEKKKMKHLIDEMLSEDNICTNPLAVDIYKQIRSLQIGISLIISSDSAIRRENALKLLDFQTEVSLGLSIAATSANTKRITSGLSQLALEIGFASLEHFVGKNKSLAGFGMCEKYG